MNATIIELIIAAIVILPFIRLVNIAFKYITDFLLNVQSPCTNDCSQGRQCKCGKQYDKV